MSLKRSKSPGIDNIPPGTVTDAAKVIIHPLLHIIHLSDNINHPSGMEGSAMRSTLQAWKCEGIRQLQTNLSTARLFKNSGKGCSQSAL